MATTIPTDLTSEEIGTILAALDDWAVKHADPTAREDRPARAAEYWVWLGLKRRCLNPAKEKDRQNYAERGITVCDRWRDSFQAFLADMGPRPGPEYSLDRIDNDGNYEPGNCHWATTIEQRHNQRRYLEAHHATCPARAQFQKARKAARP